MHVKKAVGQMHLGFIGLGVMGGNMVKDITGGERGLLAGLVLENYSSS
jgi:hypothetical protein